MPSTGVGLSSLPILRCDPPKVDRAASRSVLRTAHNISFPAHKQFGCCFQHVWFKNICVIEKSSSYIS